MRKQAEYLADEYLRKDNSFKEKFHILIYVFRPRWVKEQKISRKAYESGVRTGFYQGMHEAQSKQQTIRLGMNMQNYSENEQEFYDSFLELCVRHNIRITYNPYKGGMTWEKLYEPPQNK